MTFPLLEGSDRLPHIRIFGIILLDGCREQLLGGELAERGRTPSPDDPDDDEGQLANGWQKTTVRVHGNCSLEK